MSQIEESIAKLKRFKYHAIGRLELEDAIDDVVSWYEQMMNNGTVILAEEDFDAEKEKSMEWGYNLCKEQMMKVAVEGEVCGRVYDHINVRFADGVCKYLEPKNISHIPADVSKYNIGDKVRVIIVKED